MKNSVRLFFQLLFLFSLANNTFTIQEKIKIYALCSDSHSQLVNDWFLPSLAAINDPLLELKLFKVEQECASGIFMKSGWVNAMITKVDLIIHAIEENPNQIFIYSDVDIQFFAPFSTLILEFMQDNDMIIQRNNPQGGPCAGFFACRGNKKTHALWTQIKKDMKSRKQKDDQTPLRKYLNSNTFKVRCKLLPPTFYSGGIFTNKIWTPGHPLKFPDEPLILHHANFTVGLPHKIAQLAYVEEYVNNQREKANSQKNDRKSQPA